MSQVRSPVWVNFWIYVKKNLSLCLIHSRAVGSCASLSSLGGIVEWTVDIGHDGPLVMGGQRLGGFSIGTYDSVTSYNDVGEDGFTLPVEFFNIIIYFFIC
jgi:hypothetical protein